MKQLFFTACKEGMSVSGRSGFQVRAASAGLSSDRLQAVQRYAAYRLPVGMSPETRPADAPVRLALLETPELGRILCHGVHIGEDPTTGRFGNFFTHVLLDVPAALDSLRAVRSWGSAFWQSKDSSGPTQLPDTEPVEVRDGGRLTEAQLTSFLQQPAKADLLRFLFRAVLTASPQTRIFLAAPDREVALCVWGLLRGFPAGLLGSLTFSTFESDPLACPARIVGNCWPADAAQDLPSSCYSGGCLGCNLFTGKQSPVAASALADMVVRYLTQEKWTELDRLRAQLDRVGVKDPRLLDLVCRAWEGGADLSQAEVQQALSVPAIAALLVGHESIRTRVLTWALQAPDFAQASLPRFAEALRNQGGDPGELGDRVVTAGKEALTAGDLARAKHVLETVLPALSRRRAEGVWVELFEQVSRPEALSREVRQYLLPRVLPRDPAGGKPPARAERWLTVAPEELDAVLGLPLALPYHRLAARVCLGKALQVGPTVARPLARRPELVLDLLVELPEGRGVDLLRVALPDLKTAGLVEQMFRRAEQFRPEVLDACLGMLFDRGEGAVELARTRGEELLRRLPSGECVARLVRQVVSSPSAAVCDVRLMAFLRRVVAAPVFPRLDDATRGRLDDLLGVEEFLANPRLNEQTLARLASVLQRADQSQRERALAKVADKLCEAPSQRNLELVLRVLSPRAGKAVDLYRWLVSYWRRQGSLPRRDRVELLAAVLAVGFGELEDPSLSRPLRGAEQEAAGLVQDLRRQKAQDLVEALQKRMEKWSDQGYRLFSLAFTGLPGKWRLGWRDVLFFILVAVLTIGVGALVLKMRH